MINWLCFCIMPPGKFRTWARRADKEAWIAFGETFYFLALWKNLSPKWRRLMSALKGLCFASSSWTECDSKPGWPDWAKFRRLGDCFLLHIQFTENWKSGQNFGTSFLTVKFLYLFRKKWVGLHFERFLLKLIWSPCSKPWKMAHLAALLHMHLFVAWTVDPGFRLWKPKKWTD
jgi:hypothetical protein